MSKLRIFFVVSLVILGVLLVSTVFRPMATGGEYSQGYRESLLQTEDGWILQFNIMNHEAKENTYTINVSVGGEQFSEQFQVQGGGIYTYIHHIPSQAVGANETTITIYKQGEDTPLKEAIYYLR